MFCESGTICFAVYTIADLKSWMMSTTENYNNGAFFSIHYNYAWLCAYATPIWLPKPKALPRKP